MKKLDDIMKEQWNINFPKAIQIETDSSCNSKCTYCPHSETFAKFGHEKMKDTLFNKIINEIKDYQPKIIAPYLNNEPLIDSKIIKRVKMIRKLLPNTFIDFATNGSLLNLELAKKLLSEKLYINEIKINVPSINPWEYKKITSLDYEKTLTNIQHVIETAKNIKFNGRIRVIIVSDKSSEKIIQYWKDLGINAKVYHKVSRGGIIPTKMKVKKEIYGCKYNRESEWLHILSTGKVILCCMDWNRNYILGDINNQSIKEIWNGEEYNKIRKRVKFSENKNFICNKCEWGLTNVRNKKS